MQDKLCSSIGVCCGHLCTSAIWFAWKLQLITAQNQQVEVGHELTPSNSLQEESQPGDAAPDTTANTSQHIQILATFK